MNKNNEKIVSLNDPNTFKNHINTLVDLTKPVPHREILDRLLEQIEKVDFEGLAFPESFKLRKQLMYLDPDSNEAIQLKAQLSKCKLRTKHHLVIAIDQILKIAKDKNWGLCKNNDVIYMYNGTYWVEAEKEAIQHFLGRAAEKMGIEKYTSKHFNFKEQLFKQFLSDTYLTKPDIPNELVLINLQNGTFEISANNTTIRMFDPADFLTYQLSFGYDPHAKAPQFEHYLDRVLPDKSLQDILAEYLGYVFLRHGNDKLKMEKALILYGTGANGKSVFFEIVNALLGKENISHFSLQELTDTNGYHRAKIANKLVNYASEINSKMNTDIFKQIVSGEPVGVRLPYKDPLSINQYAKLIFNCNELPKDVEQTNAFFRRFLIIPFEATIPEKEQDQNLHTKIIQDELPGVFNWVLGGLKRLLIQKGFTRSDKITKVLDEYKLQSDSVAMFISDSEYEKSPTHYITLKELYVNYRIYCSEDGNTPVKKTNFTKRLRQLGIDVTRINIGYVAYVKK